MHLNSQTKNAPEPMSDMNPESILSNYRGSLHIRAKVHFFI